MQVFKGERMHGFMEARVKRKNYKAKCSFMMGLER